MKLSKKQRKFLNYRKDYFQKKRGSWKRPKEVLGETVGVE